jgi:4-amino-4-deoxy-L-arabinose transferase-like glycosyltransferase
MRRLTKALRTLAAAAAALAIAIKLSGGLAASVAGLSIRARDPWRALIVATVLIVIDVALNRSAWTVATDRVAASVARWSAAAACGVALLLAAHGLYFGSFTAGGSDAYGYVSQAYGWARGELPGPPRLALTLPLRETDDLQMPLGYRGGRDPHSIVPTYAPGLPLLMAAMLVFGPCGPYVIVPASAALLVWTVFLWGRHTAGAIGGLIAALVMAATPVLLFQAVVPMSDVPAGAAWTGAAWLSLSRTRRGALLAGCATALGVLIRPNLVPLAAVPLAAALLARKGAERWQSALLFCLPLVPAVALIAALNRYWYGSASVSGYGTTAELYSLSNVGANLRLYPAWLWQSQGAGVLLALLALARLRPGNRRSIVVAIAMVLVTFACYLPYASFDVWWYLRFLLPGLGALSVLIAAGAVTLARGIPQPWGRLVAGTAIVLLTITSVMFAAAANTFGGVLDGQQRFIAMGEFAAAHLPAEAVVFAVEHSGTMRFYGGRYTLRFDQLVSEPADLLIDQLERAGLHPYLLVDDFERPDAARHFNLPPGGPLPWPIVARMRERGGVTIYDLSAHPRSIQPTALEPDRPLRCMPSRERDIAIAGRTVPP